MNISGREAAVIDGPIGPFFIPAEPPETRRICEGLSRGVWAGEYAHEAIPWGQIRRVIDIGAGWGAFGAWVRARISEAEIDCYDPHALGCDFVRANDPKANVFAVAVTTEERPLFWPGEDWGAQRTVGTPKEFGVPCEALHPSKLPPCDLLKVDAECAEGEILSEYRHRPRVVAVEWHTLHLRGLCTQILQGWGMQCLSNRPAFDGAEYGVGIWVREEAGT